MLSELLLIHDTLLHYFFSKERVTELAHQNQHTSIGVPIKSFTTEHHSVVYCTVWF